MKYLLLLAAAIGFNARAFAQINDSLVATPSQNVYGISYHYGTIFVHTKQVSNTRGANPRGVELEYSQQHTDKNTYQHWGFFTRTGFNLAYYDFNSAILGQTLAASYFVEPIFKINKKLELRTKASFGLSYLSNPNEKEPLNQSYSLYVNGYLQLAVSASYHITNHVSAYIKGNYNHNSNGGFQLPNRGVNFPTASIGILYHANTNVLPHYTKSKEESWKKNKKPTLYTGIFYSPKVGYNGTTYVRKTLIGGVVELSKQVSGINAFNVGLQAYYDGGLDLTKKSYASTYTDNSSSIFVGVIVGHDFLFNKVRFFQQLGYHFYQNTDAYNNYYLQGKNTLTPLFQRYGLKYEVSKHYVAGFSLLARADVADFIDVRILYKW